jgi:hypothetical protein
MKRMIRGNEKWRKMFHKIISEGGLVNLRNTETHYSVQKPEPHYPKNPQTGGG